MGRLEGRVGLSKRAVIADSLNNRGAIASWEERPEDAVQEFDTARADLARAIELHPLDAQAFNNRGLANVKLGEPTAARRDFEEAMRIDPGQNEAWENLKLLGQPSLITPPAPPPRRPP